MGIKIPHYTIDLHQKNRKQAVSLHTSHLQLCRDHYQYRENSLDVVTAQAPLSEFEYVLVLSMYVVIDLDIQFILSRNQLRSSIRSRSGQKSTKTKLQRLETVANQIHVFLLCQEVICAFPQNLEFGTDLK